MTPQVRFHIALCEENLGNLVAAMKGFQLAAEEARQAGSTAAEVAEKAPGRAEALRKRIGTLKINVTGKVTSSKVLLDGAPLAASSFGTAIAVDPGTHVVEVRDASGKATVRKELTVGAQGDEQTSVEVHDADAPPASTASSSPSSSPSSLPPPLPPVEAAPSRVPIYIAGGAGLAFLLGSAALFTAARITISDVKAHCLDQVNLKGCDPTYKNEADLGELYLTLSSAALGVGASGLVTAGILLLTLAPRKPAPPQATITIVPTGPGIAIRGVF
jgi:hypothetical protein